MIAAAALMYGQTYDTIYNRSDELYYSEWYDTSIVFLDSGDPCCFFNYTHSGSAQITYKAFSDYTPRPLPVRGLALMHTIDYNLFCMDRNGVQCSDTSRVPGRTGARGDAESGGVAKNCHRHRQSCVRCVLGDALHS